MARIVRACTTTNRARGRCGLDETGANSFESGFGCHRLDRVPKWNALPLTKGGSRLLDSAQELRVVLQTILDPIVLGSEPDQDAGKAPVTCDDDLVHGRLPEIVGEVVLDLGQGHFPRRLPARA